MPRGYPSFDDLLAKAGEVRASSLAFLEGLTDEDLDKPSHATGEMAQWFGTVAIAWPLFPFTAVSTAAKSPTHAAPPAEPR